MQAASTPNKSSSQRRPIGVRKLSVLHQSAKLLSRLGITPNQISLASMGFAFLAATAIIFLGQNPRLTFAILASTFILLRGACNLLDGLIAIELDQAQPNGAFFNEVPDRLADVLILTSVGLAFEFNWMGLSIGLALSLLALATAYLRAFGKTLTQEEDFTGPAAKPHRMLFLAASLPFIPIWPNTTLIIITLLFLATALTVLRRTRNLLTTLSS